MVVSRRSILKLLGISPTLAFIPPCIAEGGTSPVARIAHNQLGYQPGGKKIATIALNRHSTGRLDPSPSFRIWTADRKRVAYKGTLGPMREDSLSGDSVCLADFSSLTVPGSYRVEVLNDFGDAFPIARDVYAGALRSTMRAYYGQRCGCKVDLGGGYKHRECHLAGNFDPSSGKDGSVGNHGGWHDAGDYGRYVVNSGITCGTLLWAWELFPESTHALALNIPESGGSIPDLLAELQWNLQWMLSMQDPTDGGVWHKQTSRAFCAFIMPEKDELPSAVIGTGSAPFKSTAATADFAAVMAIAARCFKLPDPAFAARCLDCARSAYQWSRKYPDVPFKNPPGVTTGEYGDPTCSDELLWAAAELFRTTGDPAYESDLLKMLDPLPSSFDVRPPSWGDVRSLGLWSYVLSKKATPTPLTLRIQHETKRSAASLIAQAADNGYGHTLTARDYGWGSNSTAGNHSLLLLISNLFDPDPAAIDAALSNLHYLLGRNCFGVSWVTQVGVRPFQHPHHRPSVADSIAAPWPGLLSGGPNARGGDQVADALPRTAPMRSWLDDERAYSLNEVAINWNAPLVFLLAAANRPGG